MQHNTTRRVMKIIYAADRLLRKRAKMAFWALFWKVFPKIVFSFLFSFNNFISIYWRKMFVQKVYRRREFFVGES